MSRRPTISLTHNPLLTLAVMAAAATFFGCGESSIATGNNGGDAAVEQDGQQDVNETRGTTLLPDTEFTRDLKIYDAVKPLEADVAAQFIKTDTDLIHPDPAMVDAYAAGDVLVSDHGDGIFRVVEGVAMRDGKTVLTTRAAKLEDAIHSGHIYIARLADESIQPPAPFREGASEQPMTRQQGLGFDKEFGWNGSLYEYNNQFADQLNDRIPGDRLQVTSADVRAEIGAEFYAEVSAGLSWPPVRLPSARMMTNGQADGTLRVKVHADDEFHYNENFVLVGDSSRSPLMAVDNIEHTILPGMFPLKFTFEVSSELDLRADVYGPLEAEVGYMLTANARAGVERKDGEWEWVTEKELVGNPYGPVFRGEKNLEASATLTNRVKLTVGERANGYLEITPAIARADFSQVINADTGACPTNFKLNAKGGVEGQLESIDVPILGKQNIMDSAASHTLNDRDLVNYSTQLELPGICDPDYEPPTHTGTLPAGNKCSSSAECVSTATCYQNTCVHEGKLRISTAWFEATDLDLFVELPDGETIYWKWRRAQGGYYDFHNCTTECANPAPHVESVYLKEDAPVGTYKVWLRQERGDAASSFEIEVDYDGEKRTFAGDVPQTVDADSQIFTFTVNPDGSIDTP